MLREQSEFSANAILATHWPSLHLTENAANCSMSQAVSQPVNQSNPDILSGGAQRCK